MTQSPPDDLSLSAGAQPLQAGQDLNGPLRRFVESRGFGGFIMTVIVLNAIILGLETDEGLMARAGHILVMLDRIAIGIFTVELILKFMAYRLSFFKSGWNIFDLIIVIIAYVPASTGFSVLRALRILRALRLISVVPRMRKVVQGLLVAIPAMGTVILLLVLVFYIFAVMATKLFGASFPQWFGSLGASVYSLFQIMTLESWSMGIVRPVMEVYPLAWLFFVPFVMISAFVVLNLFIAIIVNAMHEADDKASHDERDLILTEIRALRDQVDAIETAIGQDKKSQP